jgi:predicted DNA-binding protein
MHGAATSTGCVAANYAAITVVRMKHERELTEQIVIRLRPEQRQRLEELARREDRSLAYQVRRLLERGLQQHEGAAA